MKLQHLSQTIALAGIVILMSCQKDDAIVNPTALSLVEDSNPAMNYPEGITHDLGSTDESLRFDFTFFLEVKYQPCNPVTPVKGERRIRKDENASAELRCIGPIYASGDGQGYSEELGRVIADIQFEYDMDTRLLCGMVNIQFHPHQDVLSLEFCGRAEPGTKDGFRLDEVEVAVGSGRFANAEFEGFITLENATDILDSESPSVMTGSTISGRLFNVSL